MVYNTVKEINAEKINARIKDAIKEWGSQDDFFNGISYSKQSFHKCVRENSILPLSVLVALIAIRLSYCWPAIYVRLPDGNQKCSDSVCPFKDKK